MPVPRPDPSAPVPAPRAPRHRMFFALWPSQPVRDALQAALPVLPAGTRAVAPQSLHVTLAFVGMVEITRVEALDRAGRAAAGAASPFGIRLDALAWWRRPAVLVARCTEPAPALLALAAALATRLADAGFLTEDREYRPHLTLARDLRALPAPLPAVLEPPVAWQVREFVLVRSQSAAGGSRYEIVGRYPLPHTEGNT